MNIQLTWQFLLIFCFLYQTELANGQDWRQFRGPNASGVAGSKIPLRWRDAENLKWAVELPGRGVSSPVVVGNRVFITTFSGFGQSLEKPGDIKDLRRNLICFARKSGKELWRRSPPTRFPEDKFEGFITDHGYASNTVTSDGKNVYAFFGESGVYAFDLAGKPLWQQTVGSESGPTAWGSAASPIVYKNLLLVNACDESQALIAFDKNTGKEIWRAEAKLYEGSYSTPVIGKTKDGRDEIIIPLQKEIWGIDPASGRLKWWAAISLGKYISSTPVVGDGIAYIAAGSKVAAIRLGGVGNVTESNIVWSRNAGPGVPSPVLSGGKLYWVATNGVLTVANAETGKTLWRSRLSSGGRNITYASLTKANNVWLATTQLNGTITFTANDEFRAISTNKFSADSSPFKSSAAISNGELFLRSDRFLYCISNDGKFNLADLRTKKPKRKGMDAFAGIIGRGFGRNFEGRSRNSVGPAELLMTFDINNDDKISPEELAESPMPKMVQKMMMMRGDTNKDGVLDAKERDQMQASMSYKEGEVVGRLNPADRPNRPALWQN